MSIAMEMNSMTKSSSANRFQVNPVQKGGGGPENGDDGKYTKHYEDDTFDEDNLVQTRRPSKILALKSSFRNKDRQSLKRETRASFQVTPESDDSDNEHENLLDDNRYGRSFR